MKPLFFDGYLFIDCYLSLTICVMGYMISSTVQPEADSPCHKNQLNGDGSFKVWIMEKDKEKEILPSASKTISLLLYLINGIKCVSPNYSLNWSHQTPETFQACKMKASRRSIVLYGKATLKRRIIMKKKSSMRATQKNRK